MKQLYTIYASFVCCFFLFGNCIAATDNSSELTTFEMKAVSAPPTLVVLQQQNDGSNQILDQVPEEYPAAIPYFFDYLQKNIYEFSDVIQGKNASAVEITYAYPDHLEINYLSDTREKIVKKIQSDDKLNELRIRSAILMLNFFKDEQGQNISNTVVGFQLFPKDRDYKEMNITPNYDLISGSWILIWEQTIQIVTPTHFVVAIRVDEVISTIMRDVIFLHKVNMILNGGKIIIVRVAEWLYFNLLPKIPNTIISKKYLCGCITTLSSAASPVGNSKTVRLPCGKPFYRSQQQTCSGLGRTLYPDCHSCFDAGLGK